jgi:general secretion pathway protein M
MSAASTYHQLKDRLALYWLARTEQERRFLSAGAAVVLLALLYSVFIGPAVSGRAQLRRDLPQVRQEAAQLQALAQEAGELARQPVPQVAPMTRDSLAASLSARGITPQTLEMTGDYAKLRLSGVPFANLVTWLDAQRRENRIMVQDASITPQATEGQVDAALTLRQNAGQAGSGSR